MSGGHWQTGDTFGLDIPADPASLQFAGIAFLDRAFRAFGTLDPDNNVTAITECQECAGGSTGRKMLLRLKYAHTQPGLPNDLFVKFSRDFDNPRRDRGKSQMDLEVRFAVLARGDDFPIAVPTSVFADYHRESGTGILITDRIRYGQAPIEPHYEKCLDYRMPDPLAHYEALLTALARLAGAHQAGQLAPEFAGEFGYDPHRVTVGEPIAYSPQQLRDRVARYAEFAKAHPGLLPANIRTPAFLDRMVSGVEDIAASHDSVMADLNATTDHVALCHWNANVDNAWFWREAGQLRCGLLDWGCVSEMNVSMALWGALCSAETPMWDVHLNHLLTVFAREFQAAGGTALDLDTLQRQLTRYAVGMGVTWLLDAPAYIGAVVPDLGSVQDRYDPRIADSEVARTQLQMLTNFLNLWETHDFAGMLGAAGNRVR